MEEVVRRIAAVLRLPNPGPDSLAMQEPRVGVIAKELCLTVTGPPLGRRGGVQARSAHIGRTAIIVYVWVGGVLFPRRPCSSGYALLLG